MEEHRETRTENEPRDFIDAYLDEMEKDTPKDSPTTFTCKYSVQLLNMLLKTIYYLKTNSW